MCLSLDSVVKNIEIMKKKINNEISRKQMVQENTILNEVYQAQKDKTVPESYLLLNMCIREGENMGNSDYSQKTTKRPMELGK